MELYASLCAWLPEDGGEQDYSEQGKTRSFLDYICETGWGAHVCLGILFLI